MRGTNYNAAEYLRNLTTKAANLCDFGSNVHLRHNNIELREGSLTLLIGKALHESTIHNYSHKSTAKAKRTRPPRSVSVLNLKINLRNNKNYRYSRRIRRLPDSREVDPAKPIHQMRFVKPHRPNVHSANAHWHSHWH
jgi:hypothetical protein